MLRVLMTATRLVTRPPGLRQFCSAGPAAMGVASSAGPAAMGVESGTAAIRVASSDGPAATRRFCSAGPAATRVASSAAAGGGRQPVPSRVLADLEEEDFEELFDEAAEGSHLEDNWGEAMQVIAASEALLPQERPSEDDLLKVRATRPTMTLASLVMESSTLQRLVDLGVSLHLWDSRGHLGLAVKLDFDRDVAPLVRFLADVGVPHHDIGYVLSRNPLLLEEELQDLATRIAYLQSKGFTPTEIAIIVSKSTKWLSFPVPLIDARLGFFQKTFGLKGDEVRLLTLKRPSLITWGGHPERVRKHIFSLHEEMGFTKDELKQLVLDSPKLLMRDDEKVLKVFEVLHNEAKIPHEILARFPMSLTRHWMDVSARHKFLVSIGRAQFDPNLPNYVSPAALTDNSDTIFAEEVARTSVVLFNRFLKTL